MSGERLERNNVKTIRIETMNRKKALLLLTGFETMLLVILCMLFSRGAIGLHMFIGVALTIGVLSIAAVILIVKKLGL